MQKINTDLQVSKMDFGSYSDSIKIHDAMKRAGVKNISILCRCSEEMIQRLGNFTAPTMQIIKATLATYGLKFNMTTEELDVYENMPEDSFKDKDFTEDDVTNLRAEYYKVSVDKQLLEMDIEKLLKQKEEHEQAFWTCQIRHPAILADVEKVYDKLLELSTRLEAYVDKLENHSVEVPEETPSDNAEEPARNPHWRRPWYTEEEINDPINETEVPLEEDDEQPKEESDDEEEIECDTDNLVDLLSNLVLCTFMEGKTSSVNNYFYKRRVSRHWDNNMENLLYICGRSEYQVLSEFDNNTRLVEDLKTELKKHGLKLGMNSLALDSYQAMYEKYNKEYEKKPDANMQIEEHKKKVDEYMDLDPVMSLRNDDYIWLRFRLIEKSILSQPWWVKIFCSTEEMYNRAYKMAARMYEMEIENMRDKSIDHFVRHMNDELRKY